MKISQPQILISGWVAGINNNSLRSCTVLRTADNGRSCLKRTIIDGLTHELELENGEDYIKLPSTPLWQPRGAAYPEITNFMWNTANS